MKKKMSLTLKNIKIIWLSSICNLSIYLERREKRERERERERKSR